MIERNKSPEELEERRFDAAILREARRLQRRAFAAGEPFPVGAFFLGVKAACSITGQWREQWDSDLGAGRSPMDFSRAARKSRTTQREAEQRFTDALYRPASPAWQERMRLKMIAWAFGGPKKK